MEMHGMQIFNTSAPLCFHCRAWILFPCQDVRTCGMIARRICLPPIKLSYLLIMTEIRTRPLTTYGNTRTNVRGTWSSLTDYVPCTPASNLVLSHVISFQISLSRNFEAQYRSVNQFSLKFIYFLFAD